MTSINASIKSNIKCANTNPISREVYPIQPYVIFNYINLWKPEVLYMQILVYYRNETNSYHIAEILDDRCAIIPHFEALKMKLFGFRY